MTAADRATRVTRMTRRWLCRATGWHVAVLMLLTPWEGTFVQVTDTAEAASSRTFYVSAAGDDTAAGTSVEAAWRTLGRASLQVLLPGDQLLLRGGEAFSGPVVLDVHDAGDASRPVRIGSWGVEPATISAVETSAVVVHNTAGVEIDNLVLRGGGAAAKSSAGVRAYASSGRHLGLVIRQVDASGFQYGIDIGAGRTGGFTHVLVTDSKLHDNVGAGLILHGPAFDAQHPNYAHRDVRIERVNASTNHGDPANVHTNTGSGIVIGSTERALVTTSVAFGNGAQCAAPEGPFGIWAYDSRAITIEDSIAGSNRTGNRDGGGFDLDQNTVDSTLRRNLSFDNDGPGFMLFAAPGSNYHRNNVILANVSVGDVRRGGAGYGAITISGDASAAQVEENTVLRPGGILKVPSIYISQEGEAIAADSSNPPSSQARSPGSSQMRVQAAPPR